MKRFISISWGNGRRPLLLTMLVALCSLLLLCSQLTEAIELPSSSSTTTSSSSRIIQDCRQQEQQQPRQLQDQVNDDDEYRIAFYLTWNIAIGDGATDRRPTTTEYETVLVATNNWLTENSQSLYDDDTAQLDGVDCVLIPSGQFWYNETSDNDNDNTTTTVEPEYPHEIRMECEVLWNENSDLTYIPSRVEYLQTMNQNTEVTDFILNYLFPTAEDTLFGSSQAVSYSASTTQASPPTTTGGGSQQQQPTQAPISRPPTPTFSNTYILPVRLTFDLSIQENEIQDREPTQEEYMGFQSAVGEWLYGSLLNAYRNETTTFMVTEVTNDMESTRYDPTIFSGLTHQIILNTYIMYTANAIQDVPHPVAFFETLRSDDVSFNLFVSDYVPNMTPTTSIFRSSQTIQYASSTNGDVYAADDDGNKPTTPMPVPTTPTVTVSPNNSSSTGIDRADFENTISVSVSFVYHYRLFPNSDKGGEPTQEEWDGLAESTQSFWFDTLQNHYQSNDPNTDFVYVDGKWVVDSIEYDENEEFPYSGRYITDILFKEGSTDVPATNDMMQMMNTMLTGSDYITTYIRSSLPEDSLFHSTLEIQWENTQLIGRSYI